MKVWHGALAADALERGYGVHPSSYERYRNLDKVVRKSVLVVMRKAYEPGRHVGGTPIDHTNYHHSTVGLWRSARAPRRKPDYESRDAVTGRAHSRYWHGKHGVYRESDHWSNDLRRGERGRTVGEIGGNRRHDEPGCRWEHATPSTVGHVRTGYVRYSELSAHPDLIRYHKTLAEIRPEVAAMWKALPTPEQCVMLIRRAKSRLLGGIQAVAEAHRLPKAQGYGQVYWNPSERTIWLSTGDWHSEEEAQAWARPFRAIRGVREVVIRSEASPPKGDGWVLVGGGGCRREMEKAYFTKATLAEAARRAVETQPTDAQKKAGNYRMAHVRVHGMDVTIETPKGATRSGVSRSGVRWSRRLRYDYGYIRSTMGKDGDHVDVWLGPDLESEVAFVVDQVDPTSRQFDEHKIVLGATNEAQARAIYLSGYTKGWSGLGAITAMTIPDLRKWLGRGKRSERVAKAVDAGGAQPEIHITGREFGDPSDFRKYAESAGEWARAKLVGRSWKNARHGHTIAVGTKCVRKLTSLGAHQLVHQAVAAVPELIQHGVQMGEMRPDKRSRRNVVGMQAYGATLHIAGQPHHVIFDVKVDNSGRRYYSHTVKVMPAKSAGAELQKAELAWLRGAGADQSIVPHRGIVKAIALNRATGNMAGRASYLDAAPLGRKLAYRVGRLPGVGRMGPAAAKHIADIRAETILNRRTSFDARAMAAAHAKMAEGVAPVPKASAPQASVSGAASALHAVASGLGLAHAASRQRKTGLLGRRPDGEEHLYHHKNPLRSAQAMAASLGSSHSVSPIRQQRVITQSGRFRHSYTFRAAPKSGGPAHYVSVMRGA